MAQRRMFTKAITNSSEFLMMPPTAQLLYIHFGMNADDDGFCEVFSIMRMTESKPDDLRVLQARKFVKLFDDRVLIITDWKENNYIQKDRYTPSKYLKIYKEELKLLENDLATNGLIVDSSIVDKTNVYKVDTQVRLGKVRLGKDSIATESQNNEFKKVIEHYFTLKSWPLNGNTKLFARYLRPAKELFELCDGDLEEAKTCLDKVNEWAKSRDLDWSIETVFKKWYDLDFLKPKEKKPYFEGKRIFQKIPNGKWWCVSQDGDIRELGILPRKEQIIYR